MSQPASNQNEPSKMKKLLNGNVDESIKARLPRATGPSKPAPRPVPVPASPSPEAEFTSPRFKFMPAFWTIASVMSITVNIVLIVILLITLQMLGTIQLTANDQVSGLLGGLYTNFVAMDNATIRRSIPVTADIPLNITVPVQTTTRITLAEAATIQNAHVRINTGTLNIDADAAVTLPANTPLIVTLDFPLQVTNNIPVQLNVDVAIPLRETELSAPFQGLQAVVRPYYCLVEPNAMINNAPVCAPTVPQP